MKKKMNKEILYFVACFFELELKYYMLYLLSDLPEIRVQQHSHFVQHKHSIFFFDPISQETGKKN